MATINTFLKIKRRPRSGHRFQPSQLLKAAQKQAPEDTIISWMAWISSS